MVLQCKPKRDGPAFYLVNYYGHSGRAYDKQAVLLQILRDLPVLDYFLLGGDFNFVENSGEPSYEAKTPAFDKAWRELLSRHSLHERVQPFTTFHRFGEGMAIPVASKLDRIYTSHTEVDFTVARPNVFIPQVPGHVLNVYRWLQGEDDFKPDAYVRKQRASSDHLPVKLTFSPTEMTRSVLPCIRRWEVDNQAFEDAFAIKWRDIDKDCSPIELFDKLNQTIYDAVAEIRKASKGKKTKINAKLDQLGAAVRLYRAMTSSTICYVDISIITCKFPDLEPFAFDHVDTFGIFDPDALRQHIATLLTGAGVEGCKELFEDVSGFDHVSPLPKSPRDCSGDVKISEATRLKIALPSSRERINGLRPDEHSEPSFDPEQMGRTTSGYWGGIWSAVYEDDERQDET